MKLAGERQEIENAAEEIFELMKMSWLVRGQQGGRKGEVDMTESEFLTLDWLAKSHPEPRTVGELQRRIRVLPAQMSRVIRALESKSGKALIRCRINPKDRRKVDVTLTESGRKAYQSYREARLASTIDLVSKLSASDRTELMRIFRQIRDIMSNQLKEKELGA